MAGGRWTAGLVSLVLVTVVAACGDESGVDAEDEVTDTTQEGPLIIQPGAPGEPYAVLSEEYVRNQELPPHTEADIQFMEMMILHHAQALEMTEMVPDRSESEDVPLLALRMEISQEEEIRLFESWLEARKDIEPAESEHLHDMGEDGTMEMAGYLTDEQMAQLEAAGGEEFDELFLEFMIQHHVGAMKMVTDLGAAGGGLEPEIDVIANHIYSDQEIEILRMQQMLAERRAEASDS